MKRAAAFTLAALALAGCNPLPPSNLSKEKWAATGVLWSRWPHGAIKDEICLFPGPLGGLVNYEMSNSECNAVNGRRPYMGPLTEADKKAAGW